MARGPQPVQRSRARTAPSADRPPRWRSAFRRAGHAASRGTADPFLRPRSMAEHALLSPAAGLVGPAQRWGVNDVLGQERAFNLQCGKKIGCFEFAPTLNTKLAYDDNIFNRTSNAKGDFYTEIAPGLRVGTETERHYFNITAGLREYKYTKYDEFDALCHRLIKPHPDP
jgi:hypothetical protein